MLLYHKLKNTVKKLNEYRTLFIIFPVWIKMPQASVELVSEGNPIFFYENLKPSVSSVIGVQYQLG